MHAEDQELVGLNTLLPQSVQRVRDFRDEAMELQNARASPDDV